MKELQVTSYKDINVLTTKQLAKSYKTNSQIISKNFERNKEKYVGSKHYFLIKQSDSSYRQFVDNKNTKRPIYLWTERGALLHAKSLNTDKAWEVYDILVENYFRVKEVIKQLEPAYQHRPLSIIEIEEQERRVLFSEATKVFHQRLIHQAKEFGVIKSNKDIGWFLAKINNIINIACFKASKKKILNYLKVNKKSAVLIDYVHSTGLDMIRDKQSASLQAYRIYNRNLDNVKKALMKNIETDRQVYIELLRKACKNILSDSETEIIVEFLREKPLTLKFARKEINLKREGQFSLIENNPLLLSNNQRSIK